MAWLTSGRRRAHLIVAAAAASTLIAGLVPGTASAAPAEAQPTRSAVADTVRVIVGLDATYDPRSQRRAADRAALRSRIATAGAAVESSLRGVPYTIHRRYATLPYLALSAPGTAIESLRRSGRITTVQPDGLEWPTLADSTRIVGSAEATAHGFDGTNQVVAVLDTGVDGAHPFLTGRMVDEACFSANSNCPNGSTSQTGAGAGVPCTFEANDCRHGTHVAGIAAGRRSGSITFDGVAPGATVMPVQVFSALTFCLDGRPVCAGSFVSDQLAGLQHVIDRVNAGTQVAAVNMSLGSFFTETTDCDFDSRKPAIDTLRALGVATVISSGNGGDNTGVSSPGCISSAITVGNTTKFDAVESTSNSSEQVELLAPGTNIVSSVPGGGTLSFSGTSMAAPHVAGAWAVYRERFGSDVSTVLAALQNTGTPVTDPDNGVTKPRINLSAALAGWGFVWANEPTNPSYQPDSNYQANSTGATNDITREGVGTYRVRMPGLGGLEQATFQVGGGNIVVNAYGSASHRCKVEGWSGGFTELNARVLCHTTAGAPVDTTFTMLYQANESVRRPDTTARRAGYAWVLSDGFAPTLFQANSSSATAVNTVTHTPGSGIYTVRFPGLTDSGGNAQVTAYGSGSVYCKIRSTTVTSSGTNVGVGCHTASGALVDSAFTVAYAFREIPTGRQGAYGVAHLPSNTTWYDLSSRFNGSGGVVRARRAPNPSVPGAFLTGVYEVRLGNQAAFDDTHTMITAVGTGNSTCNVEFWFGSGIDTMLQVRCRSAAGTPTNSQFSLLYTSTHA
jgi:subtilisin